MSRADHITDAERTDGFEAAPGKPHIRARAEGIPTGGYSIEFRIYTWSGKGESSHSFAHAAAKALERIVEATKFERKRKKGAT